MRALGRSGEAGKDPSGHKPKASEASDARRAERETRLAGQKRTFRTRGLLVAGVTLAVLVACVVLYRSPLFAVTRVEVVGTSRLTPDQVIALAKVPRDATLVRFPSGEVAARVKTHPWVRDVTVARLFPNGMRIRVDERAPAAMVDTGKEFWLVDAAGMVIAKPSLAETAGLVVIRDVPGLAPAPGRRVESAPLSNALAVLAGISPALREQVRVVSAPSVDGTTLYTADRVEIVMGAKAELKKKDGLVRRILDDQHGKVVSIDVRTTDRPTWRGLAE